jgi:hypothetical protein
MKKYLIISLETRMGMNRRDALASLSVVGIGTLAGCSAVTGLFSTSSTPPQLLGFSVINNAEESQPIRVKMQDGETTVFEDQTELKPKARGKEDTYYRPRSSEWGTIEEYSYSIRLNDGPWQQLDPDKSDLDSETECAIMTVRVGTWGPNWLHSMFIPISCDYEFAGNTN